MIREASTADLGAVQALMKSVDGFWDESWRADALDRAIGSADTIALIHQAESEIDGFICAHDLGFRAYLSELVVAPHARGLGTGSQLPAEIESRLAARGCSVIVADVWRDAEAFYRARGWTPPSVILLRKRLPTDGKS